MTWRTELGERVLNSAEAALLRAAIGAMRDELWEEHVGSEQWPYGVRVFDSLTLPQRVLMLCQVSEALLGPSVPSPELTAVNEGTVAAIFKAIEQHLSFELETLEKPDGQRSPLEFYWRQLIRDAAFSTIGDDRSHCFDLEDIPDAESYDPEDWDHVVETLSDRVLWDNDYDDDVIEDASPDVADEIKESLGIEDGYFTAVVREPRDDEHEELFERLRSLS